MKSSTSKDLINLQEAVLFKVTGFPNNNTSWRFLPKRLDISSEPLKNDWPGYFDLSETGLDNNNLDFVAIKVGDVDNTSFFARTTGREKEYCGRIYTRYYRHTE